MIVIYRFCYCKKFVTLSNSFKTVISDLFQIPKTFRQPRTQDDEEEDNNNIAGVNIERESNDLLQSSYSIITGDMKSCEDLSLLNTDALRIRVTNQGKCGFILKKCNNLHSVIID